MVGDSIVGSNVGIGVGVSVAGGNVGAGVGVSVAGGNVGVGVGVSVGGINVGVEDVSADAVLDMEVSVVSSSVDAHAGKKSINKIIEIENK